MNQRTVYPVILILAVLLVASGCKATPEVQPLATEPSFLVELSNNGAFNDAPTWAPDGNLIAFHSNMDDPDPAGCLGRDRVCNFEIYVVNKDGTGLTRLTNDPGLDGYPSWSPDGTRIAFHSDRSGEYQIYIMDSDGANIVQLTSDANSNQTPAWSPDGTRIAYASNTGIHLINIDGSGDIVISNDGAGPAWSPDGTRIAFESYRNGNMDIFLMDVDGGNVISLTDSPGEDGSPVFSPDGALIYFYSNRDIGTGLYQTNLDGSAITPLINSAMNPSISPDGSTLVFSSPRGSAVEIFAALLTDLR